MKVHTILLLSPDTISTLPDQTLPDLPLPEITHYLREEWELPPGILDGFNFAPGTALRPRLAPPGPDNEYGWMILTPTQPMGVTLKTTKIKLTDDQKQVLRLLSRGLNSKQIAVRMGRSRRWVMYRIAELKEHYDAKTLLELAVKSDDNARLKIR